jgi:membrane protease YdiL (CAAX protease family)
MPNSIRTLLHEIGLDHWPPFARDSAFWLAIAAGVVVWLLLWLTAAPTFSIGNRSITKILFVTMVYYPILEEILFRGVVQSSLAKRSWGSRQWLSLSVANWLTSLLFVVAHVAYQPTLWVMLVFAPSLVFGFFRDRYNNIYPCLVLHSTYNAGFTLINILAQ